jgi:hypothetical protein
MSYLKQSKTFVLCLGVLAMIFVLNYLVLAWTEPSATPPSGNVAAPLNVGNIGQSKSGGLILNTGGAATGLVVVNGNVGIGITNPAYKLDVSGQIHATGDICTDVGGGKCLSSAGGGSQWTTSGSNIYYNLGNVGIGTANPAQKLEVSGKIFASQDICIASGACLSQLNNFIGSQLLIGGVHNYTSCTNAGGQVIDVGLASPLCRFNAASCPHGWNQYRFWTTTQAKTCPNICRSPCGGGCTTPFHSFSDSPVDRCCSCMSSNCTPRCCWHMDPGVEQCSEFCYATVTQVGCY